MSNRAIAERLGVSEKAVRKLLGRMGWRATVAEHAELPLSGADPNLSASATSAPAVAVATPANPAVDAAPAATTSPGPAASGAGDGTRAFLARLTADARLGPKDGAVVDALLSAEVYRTLSRARLRMVLEAIGDRLRTECSEQRVDRGKYTIEHVLPQTWQKHWPLDGMDPTLVRNRNHLPHTLGNLTLVTKRLNPKLSNGAWTDKRAGLAAHSVLRLNHDLLSRATDLWAEEQITARSAQLAELVVAAWPRPTPTT